MRRLSAAQLYRTLLAVIAAVVIGSAPTIVLIGSKCARAAQRDRDATNDAIGELRREVADLQMQVTEQRQKA